MKNANQSVVAVKTRVNAGGLIALILMLGAVLTIGSTPAFAGPTPLALIHGWINANADANQNFHTANATVEEVAGIVQFRGAILNPPPTVTNPFPFVLPAGFTPATDVYIPVTLLCLGYNGETGRLHITPDGTVDIEREEGTMTECFTSLDGASFALTAQGFTPLNLINGWSNAPFSTSNAAVQNINGIVHFKGAISTSPNNNNLEPFVLPAGFRPATDVFIPVDLCDAHVGRLNITPSGTVDIQVEPPDDSGSANAQCFTSLDGAWFATTAAGFAPLTLTNGSTNTIFDTSNAVASSISGIVYLTGAISNSTADPVAILPAALRPAADVYLPVDLCDANDGWIQIAAGSGEVTVSAHQDGSAITCFTSFDGVSFIQ